MAKKLVRQRQLVRQLDELLKARNALSSEVIEFLEQCRPILVELEQEKQSEKKMELFLKWLPYLTRLFLIFFGNDDVTI